MAAQPGYSQYYNKEDSYAMMNQFAAVGRTRQDNSLGELTRKFISLI